MTDNLNKLKEVKTVGILAARYRGKALTNPLTHSFRVGSELTLCRLFKEGK